MAYYPLSQIKTNLYTNGTEYTTLDRVAYTGYYFKTSTGKLFTGKTPQDRPNQELIISDINTLISEDSSLTPPSLSFPAFYTSDPDPEVSEEYREFTEIYSEYVLIKEEAKVQMVPYYIFQTPTEQDYQIGEFRRYFCKKTNEIQYVEINKIQYDLLIVKSPSILWQLYSPFNLPWQITGTQEQVAQTNKNIVDLTSQRLSLPRFGDYLNNNYLKYYKFPNISNLYTSGSEFKTKDGQNYIGFYHIHDNTGPMVGKTHTKEPHGLLFPINEAIISEVTTRYNNQPMMSTTGSINVNMGTPSGGGGGY